MKKLTTGKDFVKGQEVFHKNLGKGTFISYDLHEGEAIVEFEDKLGYKDELRISTSLLSDKEKVTMEQLRSSESWEKAVVVFKPESFEREFSETDRSYAISRDNKYFTGWQIGNSLFGDCLDGQDIGVRLDRYMSLLPEEGRRWIVDYCYITK